ncbi:E3 ubiquitin-protein ligase TRIM65-like [Trichomycterus rosablanca]|uniref:E3 ubiquitin-protein ligase TRIM65-like n=1 Tax=Trichomycterus rosablanca TaxID=2290929 RepID=UPI002F35CBB4
MAEAFIPVDQFSVDQFICPVCLDLLKDPVATPCGHSFCKVCINGHWDQQDDGGIFSCPQCRTFFTSRPALCRNTTGLKKYTFVEACGDLQEKICSQHDEPIESYCRTDRSFICSLCKMDQHKYHNTVPVQTGRSEKQNKVKQEQRKSQQRIQEKQKKLQQLQHTVRIIKGRADAAVQNNEKIFTELINFMVKKRSEMTSLIRDQEKAELGLAEQLIQQLEQEITALMRRVDELEELSQSHDHIHFLQSFSSLCVSSGCEDSSSITVNQHLSFDEVNKSLSDLKKQIVEFCEEKLNKTRLHAATEPPKSREDHLQYFCELSLDPSTANRLLVLSERNKKVTISNTDQRYSEGSFAGRCQVLCKEEVKGRCYWEMEWSGGVEILVSYKEISRKGPGNKCVFGHNSQSWSLYCSSFSSFTYCFCHNNIETKLKGPPASRIGVYVDQSAGTLSFYSISDTMRLLHTVQTTFTQPLYAGIGFGVVAFYCGSSVRFCDPKLN